MCALLGLVVAAGLLSFLPTRYTSHATAYVRVAVAKPGTTTESNAYFNASQLAGQKVKAFVPLFTSESVAQGVIDQLGLSTTPTELADSITASNATNSLTIDVTATGDTPEQAQKIADAVVGKASVQVKKLEGANSPVQVVMMAPASLSKIEKSPSPLKYLALGLLGGLLMGYVIALSRQHFDTRLRTADDISDRFDVPLLAVLPQSKGIARTEGGAKGDFQSAESLRKLRTNLRYANVDHEARVILVTSPLQGDGKSSVAANLAKVMAEAGDDVVLIDTDLRRPSVAETYGFHGPLGLLQVLVGSVHPERALRSTKVTGLSVLPTFDTPPNPSELLGSARMTELVQSLARTHVVILDAPPVLPVTDAVVLAHLADAIVVVTSSGKTRSEQLEHTLASLRRGEGNIAGVVLNRASSSKLSRLRYGDAEYGYEYTESEYVRNQHTKAPTASGSDAPQSALEDIEDPSETRRIPVIKTADEPPHSNAGASSGRASQSTDGGTGSRRLKRAERYRD